MKRILTKIENILTNLNLEYNIYILNNNEYKIYINGTYIYNLKFSDSSTWKRFWNCSTNSKIYGNIIEHITNNIFQDIIISMLPIHYKFQYVSYKNSIENLLSDIDIQYLETIFKHLPKEFNDKYYYILNAKKI